MFTFGFIGFGSMAKMLINSLVKYANVEPSDIAVTRRDKSKFHEINSVLPSVHIYETCAEVVSNTKCVFVCVKPADVKNILLEIKPYVNNDIHIICLAGTVKLENIMKIIDGKVSKLIPTITSEIGVGINLVCHSQKVSENDIVFLESYISKFGKIKRVNDNDLGFAAELTSCSPGFIASIFKNMVNAATSQTSSFTYQEIYEMITYTLYSTSKFIIDNDISFEKVIERVATKGGITQAGVDIFDELLPNVFEKMFTSTLNKRALVEERINKDFDSI